RYLRWIRAVERPHRCALRIFPMTCVVPLFVSLMWVSSVRQYSRSCEDLMAKLGFHVPRWRLRQPVRPGGFDHLCPDVLQNCGSRWMQPAHLAPAGPGSSPGTWNNLQRANRPRILRRFYPDLLLQPVNVPASNRVLPSCGHYRLFRVLVALRLPYADLLFGHWCRNLRTRYRPRCLSLVYRLADPCIPKRV